MNGTQANQGLIHRLADGLVAGVRKLARRRRRPGASLELIVLHVPKTGGDSLTDVFEQAYGSALLSMDYNNIKLGLLDKPLLEHIGPSVRALSGHIRSCQIGSVLKVKNVKTVAFLREPVNRAISAYFYYVQQVRAGRFEPMDVPAGEDPVVHFCRVKANEMAHYVADLPIEKYFFVGFLETMAQDVAALGAKLGWPPVQLPHLNSSSNVRKDHPPITDEQRRLIRQANDQDVALYERAMQLRKQGHWGPAPAEPVEAKR